MERQWRYPLTGTYSMDGYNENQCQPLCGVPVFSDCIHSLLRGENDTSHILLNDSVQEQQSHFFQKIAKSYRWYWL